MNRKIKCSKLCRQLSFYLAFAILIPAYSAFAQDPGTFRMEVEDMSLTGYQVEFADFSSGKRLVGIRQEGATNGTASQPFVGATNDYFIKVGYYDENDGESTMQLLIDGVLVDDWDFDDDSENPFHSARTFRERTINTTQLTISKGTNVELRGTVNNDEVARLDYVEFTPVDGFNGLPEVEIISPLSESVFSLPATIYLQANATDPDNDGIDKIIYFEGENKIGESNEAPYHVEWKNNVAGTYFITAKAYDLAGAINVSSPIGVTVRDENINGCEAQYVEEDGYLIMEAESGEFENGNLVDWIISTDTAGFTGDGYIQWTGSDNFNRPGNGLINYRFKINTPGTYAMRWRSKINTIAPFGNPRAEHNDSYVKFPDAQAFGNDNGSILYPAGGFGVPSGAALIKDSRAGWFKVFSGNTIGEWGWDARTNDSNAFVFVTFNSPGVYTLQLSSRSEGHAVDRITFANIDAPNNPTFNINLDENLCDENDVNQYPEVSMTSPQDRQTFANQATINIAATASDSDGSISKVDFYSGNTLISTDNTAPYQASVTGLSETTLYLTAKAFDNDGAATSSSMIIANIGSNPLPNVPPNIEIVQPISGIEITSDEQVLLVAEASDSDGIIQSVSFFEGGKLIGLLPRANSGEYAFFFRRNEPGEYIIYTKAEDNDGSVIQSDPITINVISPNIFPTASIASPSFNSLFTEGETINIVSDVADEDGTIDKVVFFANGNQIGEVTAAPFNFTWTDVNPGEYALTIQAFDNQGDSKTSEPVNVIVNIPPVISLDAPTNNSVIEEGQDIVLEVTANDADGFVEKVEFYIGDELLETLTEAPFSYTISQAQVGIYAFRAIAYDDFDIATESNSINVTVNAKPQISITSPNNNTVVALGESVTFTVDATDSDGTVERVVYFNGETQLGEVTEAPFSYTLDNPTSGTYTIRAIAFDNNNSSSLSEDVIVIVNQLPEVSLVRPQDGDSFEVGKVITIEASASDEDGEIVRVEFVLDGEKLGEDRTAPYIFNLGNLELGTYELVVNAIDDKGAISSTEPFTIELNTLPTINITSPISGTSIEAGTPIEFEVEVADQDGEVIKVEYYSNDLLIGTIESAPFAFTWEDAPTGMQDITAIAYDDNNGKTVSEVVMINVALNVPPTVTLTSPTSSTVIQEGEDLDLRVSAIDADGTITKVEFYADDDLIGEDTDQPYELTWEAPLAGTYQIKAKAIDDKNGSSFSDEIEVKVNVAPQVSISTPTNGESFVPGSTISFLASARDTDGLVSKVEFMVNDTKVGESLTAPFTIEWNKTDAGIYEVRAIATDENGGISESELVKIYIKDPNAAAARLVSLTQDTAVAPQAIVPLQAIATSGYEVFKIEFLVNGSVEMEDSESPFEMNLQVGDEGTYEVQVKAYYQDNGIFESDITTITVNRALSLERGINNELNMLVYPNPVASTGQLKFTLDKVQTVHISLTDIAGNTVGKTTEVNAKIGENTFDFSLENFPKGMYLLHVKAGNAIYVNKLIKR